MIISVFLPQPDDDVLQPPESSCTSPLILPWTCCLPACLPACPPAHLPACLRCVGGGYDPDLTLLADRHCCIFRTAAQMWADHGL